MRELLFLSYGEFYEKKLYDLRAAARLSPKQKRSPDSGSGVCKEDIRETLINSAFPV